MKKEAWCPQCKKWSEIKLEKGPWDDSRWWWGKGGFCSYCKKFIYLEHELKFGDIGG